MTENNTAQNSAEVNKCGDTKMFNRLLLAYFIGVMLISFAALLAF